MKKKILFSVLGLLILSLSFILPVTILAQMALPASGNSFETATQILPGNYSGGELKEGDQEHYYYLSAQPGQELQIQVLFSGNTNISLLFYGQDKQKLTGEEYIGENDNYLLYWLNGTSGSQKYYLQLQNQAIADATLKSTNIKLIDHFDAGSQTDAGASFENALLVEASQYQGFLSAKEHGDDEKDFYQINVNRGQNLTVKATPPTDVSLELTIYDQNRNELFGDYSQNNGAVVSGSVKAVKDGTFYIAIAPAESYYDQETIKYSLDISGDTLDQSQSGILNTKEETTNKPIDALSKVGPAISSSSKNIKFILLIIATVLIIIIITVSFLLKNKSPQSKKPEKKEEPIEKKTKKASVKTSIFECPKCGTQNPAEARFCSKCGEKLA